jgi:membrane protein DedA with SNARE-associated domain
LTARRLRPCQDESVFEHIMKTIGDSVGLWLYLIAGGLAFAEAALLVGFVLPGEIALLVGGYFCQPKYGHLELWLMCVIAVAGAIAGDSVGFELGKRFGPPLRRSRIGRAVGERRWSAVDGALHRHGGKAVLLGRFTALLRAVTPSSGTPPADSSGVPAASSSATSSRTRSTPSARTSPGCRSPSSAWSWRR